eukprot:SM000151S01523  [mRNA]  locus=s151:340313:346254:- [translate_table: standard]
MATADIVEDLRGIRFRIADIASLPLYNEDNENPLPKSVERFRAQVLEADAILFACPEYNYSVSGPLKNAIDWGTRPTNVWDDKAVTACGAGGDLGTSRAQLHLRQIGIYLNVHFLNKPDGLRVRRNVEPPAFNDSGDLKDEKTRKRLEDLLESLALWSIRLSKGKEVLYKSL